MLGVKVVGLDDATLQPFLPFLNPNLNFVARASLLVLIPKVCTLYLICPGLLTLAPPSGPVVKSALLCEHLGPCWLVQLMQGLVATGASNAPKPKDLLTGQSQASYNHYYSVM